MSASISVITSPVTVEVVSTSQSVTVDQPVAAITQYAAQGPTGPVGATGDTGPQGPAGADGAGLALNWHVVRPGSDGVVGDGATDDTTAIHAIRDTAGVDGTLYFYPGTYACELSMSVAGQRWIIDKDATLLSLASGSGDAVIISGAGCILEGPGIIDGNKSNKAGTKSAVVVGWPGQANGVTIRGLTIQNADENGVKLYSAGTTGNEDCTIEGCTLTGNEREAIYANTKHHRIRILSNRIISTSASYNAISVINDTDDAHIKDNIISGPSRMGIEVWNDGGTHDPGCLRPQVTGNTISGCTWHGISVAGKSHYATVTDNTITDTDLAAIEIAESNNSTVNGNTIHDCTGGFAIDTTTGSTFTGNTLVNCGAKPVHILDATDVEFVGNSVDGWTNVAGAAAIYLQGSTGVVISGNTTRNGPSGVASVTVDNSSDVQITGNRLGTRLYLYQNGAGTVDGVQIAHNRIVDASNIPVYRDGTLTNIQFEANPGWNYATAAPTAGHWGRGDVVWNSTPSAGGTPGWVCVTGGTTGGTWKAMANLAA